MTSGGSVCHFIVIVYYVSVYTICPYEISGWQCVSIRKVGQSATYVPPPPNWHQHLWSHYQLRVWSLHCVIFWGRKFNSFLLAPISHQIPHSPVSLTFFVVNIWWLLSLPPAPRSCSTFLSGFDVHKDCFSPSPHLQIHLPLPIQRKHKNTNLIFQTPFTIFVSRALTG